MTVQNSNVKNIYIGNGSTTSFPFTFPCPKAEYIKVFVRKNNLIAQTDNFTVDLDNATVTYPKSGTPLAAGENLVILRELPLEQPLNLVNQGPFFAEDIETTLDEEVMMIQQLREQLGRSLTVPVDIDGENAFETSVPIKPGMSFRVKDDGSGFEETDDPARVLPLASDALKKAEAARDIAIAKADVAGASAVSAAESEVAADRSATQAEAAKTAAKASEDAAAKSAAAAKVSEGNAKTSETNAATMEGRASASAQKAKDWATKSGSAVENGQYSAYHYATYAERQANTATTKAGEASSSAAAAKISENAAAKSASAAKTSETNAKSSETTAASKATAASNSAAAAKASENAAAGSASGASTSAAAAKTSETNAAGSASTASAKATAASGSAAAAKTSETNAAGSASTASAKATAASSSASAAKTSETNAAQSAADAAKSAAALGDLSFIKGLATKDEAEAGVDNTKMMTPLSVMQSVTKNIKNFAAKAVFTAIAKTVAPPDSSNDDSIPTTSWTRKLVDTLITAALNNESFRKHIVKDYMVGQNGFIAGGDWVGGLILQWGVSTAVTTKFPIAFPSSCFNVIAMTDFSWSGSGGMETSWWQIKSITNTSITWSSEQRRRYVALGK